jgi:amphi-Trp domain-containing protein
LKNAFSLHRKGADMDLMEISEKRKMGREEAAKFLHEIADSLARQNAVDLIRNGIKIHVKVPDEVTLEMEVEIESDESSIEIEISW